MTYKYDDYKISVDGTKYTFLIPEGGCSIHVLRYNEPWLVIEQGFNAIWSLMAELRDAKEVIQAVKGWQEDIDDDRATYGLTTAWDKYCSLRGIDR